VWLWKEYAQVEDDILTHDARNLKQTILDLVEVAIG
jgi:hypothetical protein